MRRGRRKTTREVTNFQQAPYGQKKNPFQPMSIFSEDEVESIHEASLKVLCFVEKRISEGGAPPL